MQGGAGAKVWLLSSLLGHVTSPTPGPLTWQLCRGWLCSGWDVRLCPSTRFWTRTSSNNGHIKHVLLESTQASLDRDLARKCRRSRSGGQRVHGSTMCCSIKFQCFPPLATKDIPHDHETCWGSNHILTPTPVPSNRNGTGFDSLLRLTDSSRPRLDSRGAGQAKLRNLRDMDLDEAPNGAATAPPWHLDPRGRWPSRGNSRGGGGREDGGMFNFSSYLNNRGGEFSRIVGVTIVKVLSLNYFDS